MAVLNSFKSLSHQLLHVIVLLCVWNIVKSELFTALVELEKVLHAENGVALDLRHYIEREQDRLDTLKQIADDYESHSRLALGDPEHHLANPVNAFLLVKRFTTDWDHIVQNLIRNNHSEELLGEINSKTNMFPDDEDLKGAATALLRLQDTYSLDTHSIASGDLQGVKESPKLSVEDCFELGRLAYGNQDYYHTIMWMEQSLHIIATIGNRTQQEATIIDYLAYAVYMQGNIAKALELTERWLQIEPDHIRAQNNKKFYEQMLSEAEGKRKGDEGDSAQADVKPAGFKNERQLDDYRQGEEFATYEALCRDEDVIPDLNKHKLTCQYVRHDPIFMLAPLKEEVMFLEPRIVIYHEIMTDTEIAKIKQLAAPRFQRATVQNPVTGVLEPAQYRVSKSSWLKDEDDEQVLSVTLKSAAAINLTRDTVEDLQVVNYGIGGHYEPHYDFARKEEKGSFGEHLGNRIATVIYYMTDVEAGGATVFPQIGVKLWPEKGAAAVWYNLMQSGEGDYRTRHAACPVLAGSKWVCNKWFHERGQEFVRPCNIDPAL